MNLWLPPEEISGSQREEVGGKGFALAELARHGIRIPRTCCLTTEAYRTFLKQNSLAEKIHLELHRKDLAEMRWEEMWDAAHRIRSLFLRTQFPQDLAKILETGIKTVFGDSPTAVRSSGLGEDAAHASFAGVHDSYLAIRGVKDILKHIRLVWASLWSDAALLYRQELGLDLEAGAMAVLVQEFIPGRVSGVVFSRNPMDSSQGVVEAVSGLNQKLVDGTAAPDRWLWDRSDRRQFIYKPAAPHKPFLTAHQLEQVLDLAERSELIFHRPQDTEWTFRKRTLFALQSRPITTLEQTPQQENKAWQLSLRRSFHNLQELRSRIEKDIIPEMSAEAEALSNASLIRLDNPGLNREIQHRQAVFKKWKKIYWEVLIPFAHGFRLFGRVYNDILKPEDPYEFIELLRPEDMESLKRNRMLRQMAELLPPALSESKQRGSPSRQDLPPEFQRLWQEYHLLYANLLSAEDQDPKYRARFWKLLERIKQTPRQNVKASARERRKLEELFIQAFPEKEQGEARLLLDLARFSYRLRDDDNIYLGRIERELHRALNTGQKRLRKKWKGLPLPLPLEDMLHALQDPNYKPQPAPPKKVFKVKAQVKPRQIKGQPAGKGLASGKARVIRSSPDLFNFQKGEILVCDAIDPNMTFVVPLAAAIVERRGGMLIHGAIIAREYGIPCVTGIPELISLVKTGDHLTVDGYLGIVIFDHN